MRVNVLIGAARTTAPFLAPLAIVFSACVATGQPNLFDESFDDDPFTRDINWTIPANTYLDGHPAPDDITGTYDMTTGGRGGGFNPKLQYDTTSGNPLSTYTNEIEVVLDPFLLSGEQAPPGTGSDFKWKSFGADGFMEIVFNSFGDMRLFHNDSDGGAGNLQPNTQIGYTDGDLLKLITAYDLDTDTVDVRYSLNGGPVIPFYSGGGIDGPIGDVVTSFLEVELFKFNDTNPENIVAKIDRWSLTDSISLPPLNSGDYNGDGVVDAADYAFWRDTLGDTVVPGSGADGNGNGTIDAADYDFWTQRYGNTVAGLAGAAAAVPEPGTCFATIACLAMIAGSYRGRRLD